MNIDNLLEESDKIKLPSKLKEQDIIDKAKETLNEEQLVLFDGLVDFISSDRDFCVVIGYAGTGKTYALSKFISAVSGDVAMTAPTNKAVKVLVENRTPEMKSVAYTTVHKMLALKMKWIFPNRSKKETFQPYQILVNNPRSTSTLNDFSVIIVDEVSMLDDDLFHMMRDQKDQSTKIIFSGDPAQIPPVGRDDSIPLLEDGRSEYDIDTFFLEKIMRQADGSNILITAYSIRTRRFKNIDSIENRTLDGDVSFLSTNYLKDKNEFGNKIIEAFTSNKFKEDPNYAKVIAWTNKTVDAFNNFIRSHIYSVPIEELLPIMEGEKLIADTPVIRDSNIIFNTSDEFDVVSYETKTLPYEMPLSDEQEEIIFNSSGNDLKPKGKIYDMKYYHTLVRYRILGEVTEDGDPAYAHTRVDIIDPESTAPLKWALSGLFKKKEYKLYTQLSERFAKTKYNYSITCHKAQGSTYGIVFLVEDDIDKNINLVERNRIKYTASSRPKDHLYILSRRNSESSSMEIPSSS